MDVVRTWSSFLLVLGLVWAPFGVASATPEENALNEVELTLEAATQLALRDNPDLAEMQSRYEAVAAIPSQVGTRPDPVLSVNALNFPTDRHLRFWPGGHDPGAARALSEVAVSRKTFA